MKTVLYLVRHGESIGNRESRTLGHTDLDLSPLGYAQAQATFEYMKPLKIDAVYSSPLIRALHTAQPHAAYRGVSVIQHDDLKEIYLGRWEGMRVVDIIRRWPYTFTEIWRKNFGLARPAGGEHAQDCAFRVVKALTQIAEAHAGQSVLIGGHAGMFRLAVAKMIGIEPQDVGAELPFPTNASITTLVYENGAFSLAGYSYDEHLRDVGVTEVPGV